MTIQETIKDHLKNAMKERNESTKTVLRGILTAFTNELVAGGKKPDEMLSDEEATAVLVRLAKQRRDSTLQFEKGGRKDLAEAEQKELRIIEKYLPEQMGENEIQDAVLAKKEALGITDANEKGKLMGAVMQELKGKADGTMVKQVVERSFE